MNEEITGNIENLNSDGIVSEKFQNTLKYARLWERIIAGIIDHSICFIIFLVIIFTFFNSYISLIFLSSFYFGSAFLLKTFIVEMYYFVFENICNGQTPGKMFMEIKVVNSSNELFIVNIFIRNFLRCTYFLPPLFIIPDIIIMTFNKEHKRFGDLIADTVVVKKYIG